MPHALSGGRTFLAGVGTMVSIAVALTASRAQRDRQPTILDLLGSYGRGEFAAAVKTGAELPNLSNWRDSYPAAARAWIDQSPSDAGRRRLAAAGLALEVSRERYERDATSWIVLRDVVEWTCRELARESQPPRGEQAWQRASVALGQRLHAPEWLALGPSAGNHLEHAWQRFPNDPRFAMASVVIGIRHADSEIVQREKALATRNRPTVIPNPSSFGGATGIDPAGSLPSVTVVQRSDAPDPRQESRQAISAFDRLLDNPDVGAEAEAHVSHLYLMLREWKPALEHAIASTRRARDRRPRYLGFVMAGLAQEQLGQPDEARAAYQQALEALPHGQTAALLLAALEGPAKTPAETAALVRESLAAMPLDDDPWRLYYYGDYFYWSTYIDQLHEALR